MGIESLGAASASNVQPQQQPQHVEQSQQNRAAEASRPEQAQNSKQPEELSVEKLEAAIDKLNEMMESSQRSLNFSVDKGSDKVVVEVREVTTDKVIRQIPNEEALRFAESFERMMGLIFNDHA